MAEPKLLDKAVPTWPCLSLHAGALWLAVSVSPNARRTAADGLHDGALRVRLCAPPVDGKANDLLMAWLADQLSLPKRAITLVRGQTSRRKCLALDAPLVQVEQWLDAALGAALQRGKRVEVDKGV